MTIFLICLPTFYPLTISMFYSHSLCFLLLDIIALTEMEKMEMIRESIPSVMDALLELSPNVTKTGEYSQLKVHVH